jgi:hypothetical protein
MTKRGQTKPVVDCSEEQDLFVSLFEILLLVIRYSGGVPV